MANIYTSITQLIGNTPLLEAVNFEKAQNLNAKILAKLEYFNPTGSTKDRIALSMIEGAEKDGRLVPGKNDIFNETTSGNTGIALSALAAAKGYHFRAFIQDFVSNERKQVIRAYGAELVNLSEVPEAQKALDETNGDFMAATAAVKKRLAAENAFVLNQGGNPENPAAHYRGTGAEIWRDTDGKVDVLVATCGTAGTITGTGRYLKEKNPKIHVVAVEPRADENTITGIHRFSDIPKENVPANLDRSVIDEVLTANGNDAIEYARILAKTDGILVGVSSGAALWAATQVARRPEFSGKNIAVILPDNGLRYLSQGLFE